MHPLTYLLFVVLVLSVNSANSEGTTVGPPPNQTTPQNLGQGGHLSRHLNFPLIWSDKRVKSHIEADFPHGTSTEVQCARECMDRKPCTGFSFSTRLGRCVLFKIIRRITGYGTVDDDYSTYISVCGNLPEWRPTGYSVNNAKADAPIICRVLPQWRRLILLLQENNVLVAYCQDLQNPDNDDVVWRLETKVTPHKTAKLTFTEEGVLNLTNTTTHEILWTEGTPGATNPGINLTFSETGIPALIKVNGTVENLNGSQKEKPCE